MFGALRPPTIRWALVLCCSLLLVSVHAADTNTTSNTTTPALDFCETQCSNSTQVCLERPACRRALLFFLDGLLTGSCRGRERACLASFTPLISSAAIEADITNPSAYNDSAHCYLSCVAGEGGFQLVRRGTALLGNTFNSSSTAAGTVAVDISRANSTINIMFLSATLVGLSGNVTGVFLHGPAIAGNSSDLGNALLDLTWTVRQTGVTTVNRTVLVPLNASTSTTTTPSSTTTTATATATATATPTLLVNLSLSTTSATSASTTTTNMPTPAAAQALNLTTVSPNETDSTTTTNIFNDTTTTTTAAPPTFVAVIEEVNVTWAVLRGNVHTNISDEDIALLLAGLVYINVTTTEHPEGELVGQILFDGVGSAVLVGAGENPATNSTGSGTAAFKFVGERTLFYDVTVAGLTGPIVASHFHGPASFSENNIVVHPITFNDSPTGLRASGLWINLTDDQIADISHGLFYLNVHTRQFPGGEIRGQVAGLSRVEFGSALLDSEQLRLVQGERGPITRILVPGRTATLALKVVEASGSVFYSLATSHIAENSSLLLLDNNTEIDSNATDASNDTAIFIGFVRRVLVFPNDTIVEPGVNQTNSTIIIGNNTNITVHSNSTNTTISINGTNITIDNNATDTNITIDVNNTNITITVNGTNITIVVNNTNITITINGTNTTIETNSTTIDTNSTNTTNPGHNHTRGPVTTFVLVHREILTSLTGVWSGVNAETFEMLRNGEIFVILEVGSLERGDIIGGAVRIGHGIGSALMSGSHEVPSSGSRGFGSAVVCPIGDGILFDVSVAGLSGPVTAAHIHGPATPRQNAGILVDIIANAALHDGAYWRGVYRPVPEDFFEAMAEGQLYANVHTEERPHGEIRGQLGVSGDRARGTLPSCLFEECNIDTLNCMNDTDCAHRLLGVIGMRQCGWCNSSLLTCAQPWMPANDTTALLFRSAISCFANCSGEIIVAPTTQPPITTTPTFNETTTTTTENFTSTTTTPAPTTTTYFYPPLTNATVQIPNTTSTTTTFNVTSTTTPLTTASTVNLTPTPAAVPPSGFSFVSIVMTFFNVTKANVNIPALRAAIAQYLGVDISRVFVQFFNSRRATSQSSVKVTVQTPVNQSQAMATNLGNAPTSPAFLPAIQAAVPGVTSFSSTAPAVQNSGDQANGNGSSSSSSGRYLSTGAIVGIAVGVGVGLLLLAAFGAMLARRKRYTRGAVDPEHPYNYRYPSGASHV